MRNVSAWLKPGAIATVVACSTLTCQSPFTPTIDSVAGPYVTTYWIENRAAKETIDHLAAGDTIWINLHEDGSTNVRVVAMGLPATPEFGSTGTWTLTAGVVRFPEPQLLFVSGMSFTPERNRLTGQHLFNGYLVRLVLEK